MSGAGRLMRHDGERWCAVGELLAPFEHAWPMPQLLFAPWVLPRELGARVHDVVVVDELAHQLMMRCADDDPAVSRLAQQTMLFHDVAETIAWLGQIEVWMGRRLDPTKAWSAPPAAPAD
jgi:hypothetical protein